MQTKNIPYPWLITLLLLGSMAAAYFLSPSLQQQLDEAYSLASNGERAALAQWFKQWGAWGPIGIILFMVLQMFLVIVPSWLPMIISNIGYGAFWGTLIAIAAVACASTVGYVLGRSLSQPFTERVVGKKQEERLANLVERYGFGIVLLFRLSPLLSTDAISIVAGMLRMSYWRYMLATLAGITPLAMAIAYFAQDLERLKRGMYWLGGIGLLLYGVYIWLDQRAKEED